MIDKKFFLEYFKKSVRIDSSSTITDPAYKFSDEDVWGIIKMAIMAHNPLYSESTVPENESYFVLLKAKQEIYYRLATSSAPFYPIEAEGASLRKDYRFEHYMSLVRRVEQEYATLWDKFQSGQDVQVVSVFIDSYHYKRRNYNQSNVPQVEIIQCLPDSEFINLEWSKFKVFAGLFWRYQVFIDTSQIYDEFEDTISQTATLVADVTNIHKTKIRIKDLKADSDYNILVISEDRNGLKGCKEISCRTQPLKYEGV